MALNPAWSLDPQTMTTNGSAVLGLKLTVQRFADTVLKPWHLDLLLWAILCAVLVIALVHWFWKPRG